MGTDDVQVLGDESGSGLATKAGTVGAATPLSPDEVRMVVDDALSAYGAATSDDVKSVASETGAAKGEFSTVTLESAQWSELMSYAGYGLGGLVVVCVLVGVLVGVELSRALVEGWR